jgi:hypothetical protein
MSPRLERDLLMAQVSFCRCPSAPERASRSLPARSTRLRLPRNSTLLSSCCPVMFRVKTEWEREEEAFICVASVDRALPARRIKSSATLSELTNTLLAPITWKQPHVFDTMSHIHMFTARNNLKVACVQMSLLHCT